MPIVIFLAIHVRDRMPEYVTIGFWYARERHLLLRASVNRIWLRNVEVACHDFAGCYYSSHLLVRYDRNTQCFHHVSLNSYSLHSRMSRSVSSKDKSLLLLSSIAGFKESPSLFVYQVYHECSDLRSSQYTKGNEQAAKHGVLGLIRSLRPYLPEACGIRVSSMCPWMTATQLTAGIEDI